MPEINKCAQCGKFKPWNDLQSCAGDSDDLGNYEHWFECTDCMSGNDLREFAKKKIEKISALKSELKLKDEKLSEYENGISIENAKTEEQYFRIDEYGYPALVECSDADGCWYVRISDQDFDLVQSGPLYLLPSQTQEQINEQ